jgi:hypothetical protein
MKPVASKCNFLCQKCAKTHLRAFVTLKNFPGARSPRTPTIKGKGRRGKGRGGKEMGREGRGGGGRGRAEKGREGREGRGGEGGDREKSTPHQKILDPPKHKRKYSIDRPTSVFIRSPNGELCPISSNLPTACRISWLSNDCNQVNKQVTLSKKRI